MSALRWSIDSVPLQEEEAPGERTHKYRARAVALALPQGFFVSKTVSLENLPRKLLLVSLPALQVRT